MKEKEVSILIAEDEEDQRILIQEALEESRIINHAYFVKNGVELLDFLGDPNKVRPDLILLDLNMPKIDGRQALKKIKANEQLKMIPVVIMTASKSEHDICLSYQLGANSYITKPIDFKGIVDTLKQLGNYWFKVVQLP